MTNEEIKKIAREYANLNIPKGLKDEALIRSIAYNNEEMFADFLQWLSKSHCIVPKKSVAEWVNDIEFFMPDKRSVTMLRIGAKSLFGKELFNEEKE